MVGMDGYSAATHGGGVLMDVISHESDGCHGLWLILGSAEPVLVV